MLIPLIWNLQENTVNSESRKNVIENRCNSNHYNCITFKIHFQVSHFKKELSTEVRQAATVFKYMYTRFGIRIGCRCDTKSNDSRRKLIMIVLKKNTGNEKQNL